jgi:hypothetical protein
MFRSARTPLLAAALLSSLLGACSFEPWTLGTRQAIEVAEVRRLTDCHSQGAEARLTLLADREAVGIWQHVRDVNIVGVDPLPDAGAYVLAELGERATAGYGLAIARQAMLSDGVVSLGASLFAPDAADPATPPQATSPCVLVALPEGRYRAAELYDPAGKLLARADPSAPSALPPRPPAAAQ